MKLVIAVIKPFKLEEVREALTSIGVQGLMVSEVKGYGRQSGHTEIYRGAEYVVDFLPKVKLEIVLNDDMADAAIEAIRARALAQAGIAVLPEYLVRKDIAAGRLAKILPNVTLISDWFRLVFRVDDPRRSIYEQIAKQMSEVPLK